MEGVCGKKGAVAKVCGSVLGSGHGMSRGEALSALIDACLGPESQRQL